MVTIRPFNLFDTLDYNNINLDILTETVLFELSFILDFMPNTFVNGLNTASP